MRELDKVLDENEKVFWEGTPQFWPFFIGRSLISLLIGLFILFISLMSIIVSIVFAAFNSNMGTKFILVTLASPQFWVGILLVFGTLFYNGLVYKKTYYGITNKRVVIQKGLIGRDFEIADFDQIANAEVNVSLIDKLVGKNSGSILIYTAGTYTSTRHGPIQKPYILSNITDPYAVFKFFKKVSHAVKTDIEYPNKYRPTTNPGYNTRYSPNKK